MKNYNRFIKFVSILLFFCCFNVANANTRETFIIDTDVGRDDVIAMLYLFKNPQVSVKAITIETNGVAHCAAAFANAAGVLRLVGMNNIPIACGIEQANLSTHVLPSRIIAIEDTLFGAANLLPRTTLPVTHDAVKLLVKTILAAKQPINILALGPLTNIAKAYQLNPSIKNKIKQIYVMGGAVHVAGNIGNMVANQHNVAEWNIYFDPAAAQVVLANLPVALVPLDVTNAAPLNERFLRRVNGDERNVVYEYLFQLLKHSEPSLSWGLWFFWDPLAAVVATDNGLCEFKMERISVLQQPEAMSGATVVDNKNGALIKVCEKVKVREFENQLLAVIRKPAVNRTNKAQAASH